MKEWKFPVDKEKHPCEENYLKLKAMAIRSEYKGTWKEQSATEELKSTLKVINSRTDISENEINGKTGKL